MVYRAGQNLTEMSDMRLKGIVIACVARGAQFSEIEAYAAEWQGSGRKDVIMAACAIDVLVDTLTKTVTVPPSPESQVWSNMEGGHIFHVKPDVEDLFK
jgi:hypothetical protein